MEEQSAIAAEYGIPAEDAVLIGGHPVLDFTNTVHWRNTERPHGTLVSYELAVAFAGRVGLLGDETEADEILEMAAGDSGREIDALRHVEQVRETSYRIFSEMAAGAEPPAVELEALKDAYADAVRSAAILAGDGFTWSWSGTDPWRRVGRALAAQAMELLLSPDRARVKQCAEHRCGWLFLDQSKNGSRRWCSMDICGSRSKMRAHYRRKKSSSSKAAAR